MKFGSAAVVFLVDGYNGLAAKLQSLRAKVMALQQKTHGLGDGWKGTTPVGVSEVELAQEGGFFDTRSGQFHALLATATGALTPQSTPRVVLAGFSGNVIGRPCLLIEGAFANSYEVLAQNEELQRANVMYEVTGKAEDGVLVHALSTETADSDSEATPVDNSTLPQRVVPITSNSQANPTVVTTPVPHGLTTGDTAVISGNAGSSPAINGEQAVTVLSPTTFSVPVNTSAGSGGTGGSFVRGKTSNGGVGMIQMEALTLGGHSGALVAINDSADGITFAELLAFTSRTTVGAQRVEVSGAVEKSLATSIDFEGAGSSPSATYAVGFARNP